MLTTRDTKGFVVAGALALALAGSTAFAQGADLMLGTWKLNLAKSTYSPGPAPKSQTLKIEGNDQARTLTVDASPAMGPVQHWEVSGANGKDLPVTGNNPNADTYMFKRVNATTLEAQYKMGGKATMLQTAIVSAGGKTLTVTATGTNAQGQKVSNVAVFDKQ